MGAPGYRPYAPQGKPRAFADELWIVDGPELGYRLLGLRLPCPTRMTVVRLGEALWVHSPVALTPALAGELRALGDVRFVVAPNSLHHAHAAAWRDAYPGARLFAVPDLAAGRTAPLPGAEPLGDAPPAAWGGAFEQVLVRLRGFTEAVFLHRASRTLIVTDLMQSMEADRVRGRAARLLFRLGRATGPAASASMEIRAAAVGRRDRVRAARTAMLAWEPARVVLAHGPCIDGDAVAAVSRAFRWAGRGG